MGVAEKEKKRLQINIDGELAEQSETVLDSLGLNYTTVVTAMLKRLVATNGVPFDLSMTEAEVEKVAMERLVKGIPVVELSTDQDLEKWFDEYEG